MRGMKPTIDLVDANTGDVFSRRQEDDRPHRPSQLAEGGLNALEADEPRSRHGQYVARGPRQPGDR
jgi:hypothetical protein